MIVYKTENKYDDQLVNHKVVEPLSQIFPAAYIFYLIEFAISDQIWVTRIQTWCFSWNVFSLIIILFRAIDAAHDIIADILAQKQRKTNIRGYVQVAKIIVGLFGGFGIISILIGQNPLSLFGGLAGISAILMLVFKDSISGFVASVQLTSLDMVKMNDWITMSGRNIEGNVVEITLTSATTDLYAKVFRSLHAAGRPIPVNDIWLAAQALEHGAVLVSRDRHFEAVANLRTLIPDD
jgi:miniconductance mechanosensitive channel